MSLQIASPFQQFFDRDGSPLDNGFVYVGTVNLNPETNPLTVYYDDALTIPAAQPLRTSNGYIVRSGSPARIYTSQEDFSMTVREKNNVLVYTVADATSLSNLATQLASSSGSSLVGYNQGGTGAVTRTVQARLRDYVSVKDFGAVGDGVTDDTVAIQAALAAGAGGTVFFPEGTYIVDGSLLQMQDGTTVIGYGATLKLAAGTYASTRYFLGTGTGITYSSGAGRTVDVTVLGIKIDGNISNVTVTGSASCYGINMYQVDGATIRDVTIKNLPGTTGNGYGLAFSYSNDVIADNVAVNRTDRQNLIVWETQNARIVNCSLKDSYFRECILVSSNNPVSYQVSYATIASCRMGNNLNPTTETHVVRFSGIGSGSVENCKITGSTDALAQVRGIYVVNGASQRVTTSNNRISDCYTAVFVDTSAASKDVIISGNDIYDCVDGIRINATIDNISVANNFVSVSGRPLYVNAAFYQSIVGNSFSGGSDASSIINSASAGAGATVVSGNLWESSTAASYAVLISATGVVPVVAGNTAANCTANVIRSVPNSIFVANTGGTVDGVATSGVIVKRSTTGNRPTLGSTDIGVQFLDTTLAAAGKPIWWTGTAWIDATGATV